MDNPEVAVNRAKAGSAIPVKFSLDGDHGLNVLAPGSPTSGSYTCSTASEDVVEQTLTATTSGLQYDLATEQYTYVWKTDRSWASSCRTLLVTLKDGTRHTALFHFER